MALTDTQALVRANEELQKLLLGGQRYQVAGRDLTRARIEELRATIDWYERRIARAGNRSLGTGVTEFGDPN